MDNIRVYTNPNYGSITVVTINGEIWLPLDEILQLLGYSTREESLNKILEVLFDDGLLSMINVVSCCDTPNTILINEPGVYKIIQNFSSKASLGVKEWIYSSIIPIVNLGEQPIIMLLHEPIRYFFQIALISEAQRLLSENSCG